VSSSSGLCGAHSVCTGRTHCEHRSSSLLSIRNQGGFALSSRRALFGLSVTRRSKTTRGTLFDVAAGSLKLIRRPRCRGRCSWIKRFISECRVLSPLSLRHPDRGGVAALFRRWLLPITRSPLGRVPVAEIVKLCRGRKWGAWPRRRNLSIVNDAKRVILRGG